LRAPLAIGLALCALVAGAGAWALSRPSGRSTLAAGTGALAPVDKPVPAEPPAAEPSEPPVAAAPPAAEPVEQPASAPLPAAEPAAPPVPPAKPAQPPPAPPEAPAVGLAADVIAAALRAHDGELQRCYEDSVIAELTAAQAAPQQDPAPLRLDAELTIDPAGSVSKLELRGDGAPEAMRSCARAAIQSWKFPVAKAATDIRFPMVFQPNIVRR
jgi:hypothetical protein